MLHKQQQGGLLACVATTLLLACQTNTTGTSAYDLVVKARTATNSVCLIHGEYHLEFEDGRIYESRSYEYTGTGFLISENGHIASCRHVLHPWRDNSGQRIAIVQGAKPVWRTLTATFPGLLPIGIDASTIRSGSLDVAVAKVNMEHVASVRPLPLRRNGSEGSDAHAVVIGYPLGVMPLVARALPEQVEQARLFFDKGALIFYLASQGLIEPLFFKGVVNSDHDHVITTDAAMTFGCSGGPVLGDDGKVIGIAYAILGQFDGANMVVPVSHLLKLLD